MFNLAYEAAVTLGCAMSFENIETAGGLLGRVLWTVLPARRRLATQAIAERLQLGQAQATDLARSSFQHSCRAFLELLFSPRLDWRFIHDRIEIPYPERLAALVADPAPAVIAGAHFGAWELGSGLTRLVLPRTHKAVVVRSNRDKALNEVMIRLRQRPGLRVLEHRQSAFTIAKYLKRGGACAFLVDHNCRRDEAIFLPFLGKIAAVNKGPALLAVKTNATVWPVFFVRKPGPRYILHLSEPFETASLAGDTQERVAAVATHYTAAVEAMVRAWPEQWLWMHNRWKTRPLEEVSVVD